MSKFCNICSTYLSGSSEDICRVCGAKLGDQSSINLPSAISTNIRKQDKLKIRPIIITIAIISVVSFALATGPFYH